MNAHDKAEALRLLSELNESVGKYAAAIRNDKRNGMTGAAAAEVDKHVDAIRSLLSAQEAEPSAEHWRQAFMALYATDSADKKCKNEFNTLKQRTLELARKGVGNG